MKDVAGVLLRECGFADIRPDVKWPKIGLELSFTARDRTGGAWAFGVSGGLTSTPQGLCRSDALWKAIGKATAAHRRRRRAAGAADHRDADPGQCR